MLIQQILRTRDLVLKVQTLGELRMRDTANGLGCYCVYSRSPASIDLNLPEGVGGTMNIKNRDILLHIYRDIDTREQPSAHARMDPPT